MTRKQIDYYLKMLSARVIYIYIYIYIFTWTHTHNTTRYWWWDRGKEIRTKKAENLVVTIKHNQNRGKIHKYSYYNK